MSKTEILRSLRLAIGDTGKSNRHFLEAPGLAGGISKGITAELLGNATTEWLLKLFNVHRDAFIFWCEKSLPINPTAIHQRGIALERIKFLQTTGDLQQALRMVLESGLYPFVVAPNRFTEIKIFQRFQLLTEKSESILFLMAEKNFSSAWPISLQLEINYLDGEFEIHTRRQKHASAI